MPHIISPLVSTAKESNSNSELEDSQRTKSSNLNVPSSLKKPKEKEKDNETELKTPEAQISKGSLFPGSSFPLESSQMIIESDMEDDGIIPLIDSDEEAEADALFVQADPDEDETIFEDEDYEEEVLEMEDLYDYGDEEGPEICRIIKERFHAPEPLIQSFAPVAERTKENHHGIHYGYSSSDTPEVKKFFQNREQDTTPITSFKPVPVIKPLQKIVPETSKPVRGKLNGPSSETDVNRYIEFRRNVKRLELQHEKRMTQLRNQYQRSMMAEPHSSQHHHWGYSEHICKGDTDVESEAESDSSRDNIDEDGIDSNWENRKRGRYTTLLDFMETMEPANPTTVYHPAGTPSAKRVKKNSDGGGLSKLFLGLGIGVLGTFLGLWGIGRRNGSSKV
ncbi:hypothetical protein WICPIJ_000073 [Wickerhamomyces pijperi]|uniref:Uncharacterized protein n=1 Tax=Wickerhamomyces pijperi TaxID=599730 RepID=A0A9P8QHS8_WICPI|nr:hypothetical protein WICPIJ_000073 [Wickerhamomyces pijperi]